ncbi:hypothetical protein O3P69_012509 [Scylla paramamosain]|uniref:Uncharacterized protein n=1 Tax=Scylla paramamosain TaxID=85552 RepID=A0AAW0SD26_SCYPA
MWINSHIEQVANRMYQKTVYGMAARLPFSYTGAVVLGSHLFHYHDAMHDRNLTPLVRTATTTTTTTSTAKQMQTQKKDKIT